MFAEGGWLALLTGMGIGFEACGISPPAPPTSIAAIYPISDLNDPCVLSLDSPKCS